MDQDTAQWLAEQISAWRSAAHVKSRPDWERLADIFARLQEVEVPEGFAAYMVLACEWLLRLRKVDPTDVEKTLLRIEGGLRKIMGSEEAYLLTEALAPAIRRLVGREPQLTVLLEQAPPPIFSSGELVTLELGDPITDRMVPKSPVRVRPGPLPHPAPWIAGLVVDALLMDRAPRAKTLGMELTSELLGKKGGERRKGVQAKAEKPQRGTAPAIRGRVEAAVRVNSGLHQSVNQVAQ